MAPVGTHAWQNIFTTLSQTRIDPTGVGHTGPGFSDFVFVQQICGTPPTIAITRPQDGGQYVVNQTVYANYSCSGSYVTACVGPVPSGSAIDTSSAGSKTFEVTAVVSSGPSADRTVTYQVVPGPLASLSSASVNFGNVYLGLPAVRIVTLTNVGDAPMSVGKVLVSGGNDPDDYIPLSLCPSTLAAGKSCQIVVTFTADSDNYSPTGVLSVVDNAYDSPQTVALSATVINPQAWLSAWSLSFGAQKVGTTSAAKAVTLKNTGTTALTITSIAIAGTNPGDFAEVNNCPLSTASLAPTASCTINVTFKPTTKGSRSGKVVITDNALLSPQVISLSGTGI
jgi:hypothetical protein